jgi:hypothetical protein
MHRHLSSNWSLWKNVWHQAHENCLMGEVVHVYWHFLFPQRYPSPPGGHLHIRITSSTENFLCWILTLWIRPRRFSTESMVEGKHGTNTALGIASRVLNSTVHGWDLKPGGLCTPCPRMLVFASKRVCCSHSVFACDKLGRPLPKLAPG